MEERIDPGHRSKRQSLTYLGILFLVIGGILVIPGGINFAKPFFTKTSDFFASPGEIMDSTSQSAFTGIIMLTAGFILAASGLGLLLYANKGKIIRYSAAEVAPPAVDTFNTAASESKEGIRQVAGAIAEGIRSSNNQQSESKQVVKIKCRACGYLESEDAKFCSSCSAAI